MIIEHQRTEFKKDTSQMSRELVWIRKGMATLGDRAGHKTEKVILGFWRDVINERFGIDVDDVKEPIFIKQAGHKRRTIERELDMFADGDPPYPFEVKFCIAVTAFVCFCFPSYRRGLF